MDANKKEKLANIESEMLDEYTQSIIKNGLRPMFEFNFFQEDIKQAAAELQKIQGQDELEVSSYAGDDGDGESSSGSVGETTTLASIDDVSSTEFDSLLSLYEDFNDDEHNHHHHPDHEHEHQHEHEHHEHDGQHDHGEHGEHDHHHHDHHEMSGNQVHFPTLAEDNLGLESTRAELTDDERSFIDINNDLSIDIYKKLLKKDGWGTTNFVFSSLAALTSLSMLFLGARGDTSWQINELLKLDDILSFNPHLLYKNVSDSLIGEDQAKSSSTCVKQLFIDEAGTIL